MPRTVPMTETKRGLVTIEHPDSEAVQTIFDTLDAQVADLQSQLAEVRRDFEGASRERGELRAANGELTNELNHTREQLRLALRDLESARAESKTLDDKVRAMEIERARTNAQLDAAGDARTEVKELQARIRELETAMANKDREITDLKALLADYEAADSAAQAGKVTASWAASAIVPGYNEDEVSEALTGYAKDGIAFFKSKLGSDFIAPGGLVVMRDALKAIITRDRLIELIDMRRQEKADADAATKRADQETLAKTLAEANAPVMQMLAQALGGIARPTTSTEDPEIARLKRELAEQGSKLDLILNAIKGSSNPPAAPPA